MRAQCVAPPGTRRYRPAANVMGVDSHGAGRRTSIMLLMSRQRWILAIKLICWSCCRSQTAKRLYAAAVLHDLNQAFRRYATHFIALREGNIVAQGAPKEIVTAGLSKIYGLVLV